MGFTHEFVDVGQVKLHVASAGSGPPVVLLHGFPEFWYSWRHQMKALAAAGFRALAPDLRGYNLSDKPSGVRNYRVDRLVDDVAGLLRTLGYDSAHIAGHDWGGVLAWYFASWRPVETQRLIVMNGPHPNMMLRKWISSPAQLRRSWYIFAFQLPRLPELRISAPSFMPRALRGWAVHKENFTPDVIDEFRQAMAQPGAATAAVNYYRAALRRPRLLRQKIQAPTLVIWGEQDRALGPELLDGLGRYVPRLEVERIADSSHWVQQDCPERVNRLMVDFLKRD